MAKETSLKSGEELWGEEGGKSEQRKKKKSAALEERLAQSVLEKKMVQQKRPWRGGEK